MRETEITEYFGDAEHHFCLTLPEIVELERTTDSAIGAVYGRVSHMQFTLRDVRETIRLGLIGGGMAPQRAAQMVETYVDPRPLAEVSTTALAILTALFFGRPADPEMERTSNG